jgi:hypothetical protein
MCPSGTGRERGQALVVHQPHEASGVSSTTRGPGRSDELVGRGARSAVREARSSVRAGGAEPGGRHLSAAGSATRRREFRAFGSRVSGAAPASPRREALEPAWRRLGSRRARPPRARGRGPCRRLTGEESGRRAGMAQSGAERPLGVVASRKLDGGRTPRVNARQTGTDLQNGSMRVSPSHAAAGPTAGRRRHFPRPPRRGNGNVLAKTRRRDR